MKKYPLALIVLLLATLSIIAQPSSNFNYTKKHLFNPTNEVVLVVAHRAAHNNYPENSLAAVQEAIDLGVDIVEIDVQVSKDGVPMIMHDGTIDRTTNGSGELRKFTLEELKSLRLKGADGAHQIPTLKEMLELGAQKIFFDLDMKVSQRELKIVMETIKNQNALDYVFFYDGEYRSIRKLNKKLPDCSLMIKLYNTNDYNKIVKKLSPDIIHLGGSDHDRDTQFINNLLPYHKALFANALGALDDKAINSPKAYDILINKGVNIIQTDHPKLLLDYLKAIQMHK